ncbi:MAG: alkaline phosphatase D family protein [Marmoricola sp.]
MPNDYFAHGIASGDPRPTSVVLWTRVTPTPASKPGSGAGPKATVRWEVSTNPRFTNVVRSGQFSTSPSRDHTVKVDVTGLQPARGYYYRFSFGSHRSDTGRTRTAPGATSSPANLRFGVVSCANLQAGWFSAYRHMEKRDDLHAVLFLGDYIYEYGPGEYGYGQSDVDIRKHEPPHEILNLADYRQRHAQYKRDADVQRLHAKYAFIATWDDHESADDAWKGGATNHNAGEGAWSARRAASHKAYDEWMPVRMSGTAALGDGDTLYRRLAFGDLVEISMLDLRSYREQQLSAQVDPAESDPDRTITGRAQMDFLKTSLTRQVAQWKLVGNPVMIAPVTFAGIPRDLIKPVNDMNKSANGFIKTRRAAFRHLVGKPTEKKERRNGNAQTDRQLQAECEF